jgi:hypothetical protein
MLADGKYVMARNTRRWPPRPAGNATAPLTPYSRFALQAGRAGKDSKGVTLSLLLPDSGAGGPRAGAAEEGGRPPVLVKGTLGSPVASLRATAATQLRVPPARVHLLLGGHIELRDGARVGDYGVAASTDGACPVYGRPVSDVDVVVRLLPEAAASAPGALRAENTKTAYDGPVRLTLVNLHDRLHAEIGAS